MKTSFLQFLTSSLCCEFGSGVKQAWTEILALHASSVCDPSQVTIPGHSSLVWKREGGQRGLLRVAGVGIQWKRPVKLRSVVLAAIVTERSISPTLFPPCCVYFVMMCLFFSQQFAN